MNRQVAKPSAQLPTYDEACRYLASVSVMPDAKVIEDKADGIVAYAKASRDPKLLAEAVRIKMEAGRHIGRIIAEMQKRGELATQDSGRPKKKSVLPGLHIKTLKDIGFSRNESVNYQWLWRLKRSEYDRRRESIVKKMLRSLGAIYRQASDDERRNALFADGHEISPGFHVGDFRDLSPKLIADESVELVFTDPPYDRDAVPLYIAAAKEAARILKPGGSLICYTGHIILPDVLPTMAAHLKYFWIGAAVHVGGGLARMDRYGIIVGFKPLLWFVKEYRGDRQTFINDTIGTGREKDFHEWQQAIGEAEHFIAPLTTDTSTVVDFFVGGGTTLLAAKKLKRKYIGFEINPATALKTAERLQ